jgi:hypothetical protein
MGKWMISLKIQQEIDLLQYSIPEVSERIETVLNEWDYSVVNNTDYKFTFKRNPGYMPRHEVALYTHNGEIELVESDKSGILEMKYTVDYISPVIFALWIVFIGATTDTRAYCWLLYFFYRLSLYFTGFFTIYASLYHPDKTLSVRKNCREMLLQIADG